MDISTKAQNNQDTIHRPRVPQEEGRSCVDASVLLRRGNKILTEGNTETEYGVETEGKAIQILPHLGIHLI